MRYYDITLRDKNGVLQREWTSYPIPGMTGSNPTGTFDAQAQNVLFDFPMAHYATATGVVGLTIEGVSLGDIYEASTFVGMQIEVRGGMGKGLPLAKPYQAGLLLAGSVFLSYGNWEGTDMRLELVIAASPYAFTDTGNTGFVFNWPKGTQLSDALKSCFTNAFPGLTPEVKVGSYVLAHDEVGHYRSLEQLATMISGITKQQVHIAISGSRIMAFDGTQPPTTVTLAFEDMVGQPTWIQPYTIQIKMVMRADLSLNSVLQMPKDLSNVPGFVIQNHAAYPGVNKYKATFRNNFSVTGLRHVGAFRSPDAKDWVTIINAVQNGT